MVRRPALDQVPGSIEQLEVRVQTRSWYWRGNVPHPFRRLPGRPYLAAGSAAGWFRRKPPRLRLRWPLSGRSSYSADLRKISLRR
jgi:hypothetical protein